MEKEYTVVELLINELRREEKNYEHALDTGKNIEEIIKIQSRINYLKVTLSNVQNRYNDSENSKN